MTKKLAKITISQESKEMYEDFKSYNLNDKSKRYDTEIVKMIRHYQEEYPELFKSVKKFLNENRKVIIAKVKNKKMYKDIISNYNIMFGAVDIVHLNQIVNEFFSQKINDVK